MKTLISILTVSLCSASAAYAEGKTMGQIHRENRCVMQASAKVMEIQKRIIERSVNRFNADGKLLDQIFHPQKYTNGPRIAFVHEKKVSLNVERNMFSEIINAEIDELNAAQSALAACVK